MSQWGATAQNVRLGQFIGGVLRSHGAIDLNAVRKGTPEGCYA